MLRAGLLAEGNYQKSFKMAVSAGLFSEQMIIQAIQHSIESGIPLDTLTTDSKHAIYH
jgi:hypothetical protein